MAPRFSPAKPTGGSHDTDSELPDPSKPFARMSSYDTLKNSSTGTIQPLSTSNTLVVTKTDLESHKGEKDGKKRWKLGRLRHLNRDLAYLVHPDDDLDKLRPNVPSIITVLVIFIGFAILLAVAARLPIEAMRWILVSLGCVTFFWALFVLRRDCWEYSMIPPALR